MRSKRWKRAAALGLAFCLTAAPVLGTGGTVLAEEEDKDAKLGAVEIDVTDFGADPSGQTDSTEAVRQALAEAKKAEGEVVVNFPEGEYYFWKDYASDRVYHTSNSGSLSYPEKHIAILLEDMDNVTLEGNGSSLIMHGDMMAIAAVESSNVTFRDFTVDYKDPDTIDISVVGEGTDGSGNPYTDFYVPANYNYEIQPDGRSILWKGETSPVTGEPYWQVWNADFCAMIVVYKGYDQTVARASDKWGTNPFNNVSYIEQVGENVLRFTYSGWKPSDQEGGNVFLLSDSQTRKTTGAFFWESEDLLVENCDVHYLSGFGWLTQMCKNVEFKGIDFLPKYGTGKYTTSNADQIHVSGCGGYFKVTDCNFSVAHDDPINIHGTYMRVEEVIDSRTLRLGYIHYQTGGFKQYHEGDEVLFYSRTYLEPPAGEDEEKPYVVASSIGPGEEYNGEPLDMRTHIVTFEEDFSEETLNDLRTRVTRNGSWESEGLYVAENVTYTPEVRISGCQMKSIPTRGILCTTRKPVIIENNTFENMAMANIYLSNDADYWYESGPIRNMIIRNNEFYIRPAGQNEWGDVSGIYVNPVVLTGVWDAPPSKGDIPIHQNITVEWNTFHMANDNVVTANGVDGMKIIDNKIVRDDPQLNLTMTVADHLEIGEAAAIQTDVQENTQGKDVFKFTNCKNVLISGNTYDEGFNLNVTTGGDLMSESDVTIEDEELTLNQWNGNMVTSASQVKYMTSDPSVAYVNEQGQLVGVQDGTIKVTAYVEWDGTVVKSNETEVTVGQGGVSSVELSADRTEIDEAGGTAELTFTEGAKIQVLDPVTRAVSGRASVEGNTYTALQEGVVLVRAEKDGKSCEILMVNSFGQSSGNTELMNTDQVSVENLNAEYLSGAENGVSILAQSGSELYQQDTYVNNLVKIRIPDEMKGDLRIQAEVTGLPERGDGYNNAGILLYKDGNNYYSVGKKGHYDGITAVYEENAASYERGGSAADNGLDSTVFEIEILDNTATVRYQDADGVWQTADSQGSISNITGGELYLALSAWINEGGEFETSFRNIKMAKASETTTEDMGDASPVHIFDSFDNEAPEIASVDLQVNGAGQTAAADVQVSDADGIGRMIYQWNLTDSEGRTTTAYTAEPEYTPLKTGTLQVNVIAMDAYGKPAAAESEEKAVEAGAGAEEALEQVYLNGNAVKVSEDEDAVFYLPADYAEEIRISYDLNKLGAEMTVKNGSGDVLADMTEMNEAVIELTEELVIERDGAVYTIRLIPEKRSVTDAKALRVNGEAVDLAGEIRSGTGSYFRQVSTDEAVIELEADESVSSITAVTGFYSKEVANESSEAGRFLANVDLTAGVNVFYITVTAEDGRTAEKTTLYLFRDGFNESALSDLKVNGTTLDGFDPAAGEYTVFADAGDETFTVEAVHGTGDQTTAMYRDGVQSEGTEAEYELKPGLNRITVANKAENMWDTSYYTINVIADSEDNADLFALEADQEMTPAFDPDVTEYEINMSSESLTLRAQAQMAGAEVRISSLTEETEGTGSAEKAFTIYEGENPIKIEVTAPDGKTMKTYTVNVNAEGFEYASDRMDLATKTEVGYGSLQLDKASSGSGIALVDENNDKREFAKGLGAHAQSEITYNIAGQGYETFRAYVGIDYAQVTQIAVPSSVTFRVVVDGEERFDSGEMKVNDPMQKVEVDVRDAEVIQLFADQGENNYNDHADWADAKFTKPLTARPDEPEEPEETADKTALNLMIAMAEKLEAEQAETGCYTEESWAAVQAALDEARALAEDRDASQEDVDNAFLALITEINLLENAVQRVALQTAIEGARAILAEEESLADYTPESVENLRAVLAEAERVYAEEGADQETVNAAARSLMDAVTSLVVIDKETRLDILIQKAEELLAEADQYTSASVEALNEALEAAYLVADNRDASDEEINAAYSSLAEAMASLVRKADKSELKTALDKAAEILSDTSKYVEESVEGLAAAADAAQAVYDLEDADAAEVGEAVKSLVDEILKARLMGDVDGNGDVDSADSAKVLSAAAEAEELDGLGAKAADVNRDGVSDSGDAAEILAYAAEAGTGF